jgi:hypothetical protein
MGKLPGVWVVKLGYTYQKKAAGSICTATCLRRIEICIKEAQGRASSFRMGDIIPKNENDEHISTVGIPRTNKAEKARAAICPLQ